LAIGRRLKVYGLASKWNSYAEIGAATLELRKNGSKYLLFQLDNLLEGKELPCFRILVFFFRIGLTNVPHSGMLLLRVS